MVLAPPAGAQSGLPGNGILPHAHVAPTAPGTTIPTGPGTNHLNAYFQVPDGTWNYGESFPFPPDQGSLHGVPSGDPNLATDVVPLHPSGTWFVDAATWHASVRNYVGTLHPGGGSGVPVEAAFHVTVPSAWQPGTTVVPSKPLVLVVTTPSTTGYPHPAASTDPFPYPGIGRPYGLRAPHPFIWDLTHHTTSNEPYQVVGAYIVPRTAGRPLVYTVQRCKEIVSIVKQLLTRDFSIATSSLPVLLVGSSFGGYTAMMGTMFFPDDFHAGISFGFPPDMERGIQDHETHTLLAGLGGHAGNSAYDGLDFIQSGFFLKHRGSNFVHSSFLQRFHANRIYRPFYHFVGDEDLATHGDDWIPVLDPQQTPPLAPWGIAYDMPVYPGGTVNVPVFWSIMDKRCHQSLDGGTYQLPGGGAATSFEDAIYFMLPYAWGSATLVGPLGSPPPGVLPGGPPLPNRSVLKRPLYERVASNSHDPPQGTKPNLLQDGAQWVRRGIGTRLGADESLRVGTSPQGARSIYVGSADGVVSRLIVDATGCALAVAAQSRDLTNNRPVLDLGASIRGLALGELDGNHAGNEVVVGTHRGLHVLDGETLDLIRETIFADWEFMNPGRIQVVDLDPTNGNGREILLRSDGGHLLVFDTNLALVTSYPEPGIVDLVAANGGNFTLQGGLELPIFFYSHRRQVFAIDLARTGSPSATLLAASGNIVGIPRDMDLVQWNGQPALVTIIAGPNTLGGQPNAIRVFDLGLNLITVLGTPPPLLPPPDVLPSDGLQVGVGQKNGATRVVVLNGATLYVYDANGAQLGQPKHLGSYGPSTQPITLEVADLLGSSSDEVLVGTDAGHVVWFTFDQLETNSGLLAIPPCSGAPGYAQSNQSLSATWGMTTDGSGALHVVDQTATVWRVDPTTGSPTYVTRFVDHGIVTTGGTSAGDDLPHPTFPIRDLTWLGPVIPDMVTTFPSTVSATELSFGMPVGTYIPPPVGEWWNVPYPTWLYEGFLCCNGAGDAGQWPDGSRRFYFWNGQTDAILNKNLMIEGTVFPSGVCSATWATTGTSPGSQSPPSYLLDLRNDQRAPNAVLEDTQALRLGFVRDHPATGLEPDVVTATVGGSVQVLDRSAPQAPALHEGPDHGWGGMALAVGDLGGGTDQRAEVVVGTVAGPTTLSEIDLSGYVQILHWDFSVGQLVLDSRVRLDVWGICGLAIADVDSTSMDPELIVCSAEGDLMIYEIVGGSQVGAKLYHRGFQGAVGMYNAIHVGDYVVNATGVLGSDDKLEIYVAGSFGMRRLDIQ